MTQGSIARVEGGPLKPLEELIWVANIPTIGAQRAPDQPATLFPDASRTLTYRELDQASDSFAALLRSRGVRAGERIAHLGRNSDLFYPVLFGAIRAHVVLVPINPRLTASEIHHQLADSRPRILICDPELEGLASEAGAGLPGAPDVLLTRASGARTGLDSELRKSAPAVETGQYSRDQVVLQLYTSGTTGRPKGVLISHYGLSMSRHSELSAPQLSHLGPGCTVLSAMPNFHIGGISWVLMGLIRTGTVVLTADASGAHLLRLLNQYNARHAFIVPTVIRALVDEIQSGKAPAPTLEGIFYGAMAMSESLLRDSLALFNCAFVQFFGMTENSGSATLLGPEEHDLARPDRLKSVGRPYPGMTLEIRAPDRRAVRRGEHGEVWVKSPTLMSGYWNRPTDAATAIVDGWYASGDGGYLDDEGFLYLTDRIKDMIISGGENVYPVEVEEALRQHPAVLDVAVVGHPDPRWGERVVAFAQLRPGAEVKAEEVIAFARKSIAGYKCPKALHLVAELPRTASGKVQRAVLRQQRP